MTTNERSSSRESAAEWFERLFDTEYVRVCGYVARRVPRSDVEDVVVEIFLVVWRRREDAIRTTATAWLYGIAHGVIANFVRAAARSRAFPGGLAPGHPVDPRNHADLIADHAQIVTILRRLPENDREILMLVEWDGFSAKEAAEILGCSASTARVRLHRARSRLQQAARHDDHPPSRRQAK